MKTVAAIFSRSESGFHIHRIRELTATELAEWDERCLAYDRVRKRFSLLFILERNFRAFQECTSKLPTVEERGTWQMRELDRHLMNYLSSAYALREHLARALIRDFGRKSESVRKFHTFLSLLEAKCFAYAFFHDFRNYVQHCGFPVGKCLFHDGPEGKAISVTHDRDELVRDYDRWIKSKLNTHPNKTLNLVALAEAHHKIVISEFSTVLVAEYGSGIDELEGFFQKFCTEARLAQQDARAVVLDDSALTKSGGQLTYRAVPTEILRELGLQRKQSQKPSR